MPSKPKKKLTIEQPEWIEPLLQPARYKGLKGGRGSGKSHFVAERLVEDVGFDDLKCVCIREVQKDLKHSVKSLIESKIRKFGLDDRFRILESYIEKRGGEGLFLFQGMQNHTADSIKSLEGFDRAWVEEAHRFSVRSFDLLRPTLRNAGAEMYFTWNPDQPSDPVDQFFCGNDPRVENWQPYPGAILVEANLLDNPWFPPDLRIEMEYDQRRDPDKYSNIWCGKYKKQSSARVFRNWRVEEFETPDDARFYHGADWGFSIDPSVLIRCYIKGRMLFVDAEVYQIGCEIDNLPLLFDRIPSSRKWPIKADSARPETISYMQRHGFPQIVAAAKGPGSVEDGVEFLKTYDIIVHPRCQHTIDELSFYSWEVDPKTEEVLPKLADKKNHVIDALRYSVEGLRTSKKVSVSAGVLTRAAGLGRTVQRVRYMR